MKIKQLLLAAAAMVMAVACNEVPEPTPEVTLSVEPALVEFVAEGGEQTVALTASAAWTAEPSEDWITLDVTSGTEGQDVKVTVGENEAEEAREGKVVFTAGDKKAELVVKQAAVEGPVCAATAIIAEEYEVEVDAWSATITFKITTANAVEGAHMYRLTSLLEEEGPVTPEYIFENSYYPLEEGDGLNEENFEVNIWADFEEEYTFLLAVKDAEGLTKMVTKTVTAPKGPIEYSIWDEKDDLGEVIEDVTASADIDAEFGTSIVELVSSEYKLTIEINCAVESEMEYTLLDEEWPTDKYITSVVFETLDGTVICDEFTTASLLIQDSPWMGQQTSFSGQGVNDNGEMVVINMGTAGLPEGLGGDSSVVQFEVASAKFYHSSEGNEYDIESNDKRYFLELVSKTGMQAFITIDNYYSLEKWQGGTPILEGSFLEYDPEYPEDPGINLEETFVPMYMTTSIDFLFVTSGMSAGMDQNIIQGQFTAQSYMDNSEKTFIISTPEPIAMYSAGEGGGVIDFDPNVYRVSEFEHNCDNNNVVTLIARTGSGNLVLKLATTDGTYASEEGMYFSVEDGNLSGYFYDFIDDVDYNFVEGGVTISVVDGQYSWTVSEGGCYMQDENATRKYSIVPGTYAMTITE